MTEKKNEESRLQAILECSRLGTWEWNVQTGETRFNDRWAEIVGYTLDELAPISIKTWESLAHPDDLIESNRLLECHFSGELPYYDFESRMKHKDGHWVWVHDRGKVVSWSSEGQPLLMLGSHEDITEQELSRTKFREERDLWNAIIDTNQAIIVGLDKQHLIRIFNRGAEKATGYSEAEVLGKDWCEIFLGFENQENLDTIWKSAWEQNYKTFKDSLENRDKLDIPWDPMHENNAYTVTGPLQVRDGAIKTILWQNTKIYSSEEEDRHLHISIGVDMTERMKAEEALQRSESLFQQMLTTVPDMISIHDHDMNILYSNWNGFGTVEESKRVIGTKCYRTYRNFDSICPDCKGKKVLKTRVPFQEEVRLPDGRWIDLRVLPIHNTEGDPTMFVEWVQDISKQKLADEHLAAERERLAVTLESIGDGVITTDTNGNIVLLNKAAQEMTGWTSREAQSRPLSEVFNIINEITRQQCENPVEKVLKTGQTVELANHTALLTKDNREIIIADSAAPIKTAEDETIGVVLVFRDMTEKKKLESAVEVSSKLESLGVLAGGIAHDFNNLLGGIYGNIDLALESAKNETTSQYLTKTISTLDRARALTQQLLTFAKGGTPVQKIAPLFPFVQEAAQFALSGSNVSCDFDIQQNLWNCNYDRNQIGQVIDNLIINAQQAMPVGGTINVSARNISLAEKEHPLLAKGNYVRIAIRDSGVGIPKELLDKIFDPFFTTKTKGHGLGLATCYSIVNRHDGCIDVYSEPGNGSVFNVYLPAVDAAATSVSKQSRIQHAGSGTFLVMDDEEVMRDMIKQMLESFGYNVVCKDNGKDALDFLAAESEANRPVTGLLFDLTVPGGMGGMEAIAELRKIDAKTPAFVASGYADGPVMKNPVEYGFAAGICKPFRKMELVEMLEKHMKRQ